MKDALQAAWDSAPAINRRTTGNIVTQCVNPPVPTRQWDWVAYVQGDEEANGPTGRGPTECEALRDLCEQLHDQLRMCVPG